MELAHLRFAIWRPRLKNEGHLSTDALKNINEASRRAMIPSKQAQQQLATNMQISNMQTDSPAGALIRSV